MSNSIIDRVNSWAKTSVTLKLVIIGFIILMLLIPTFLVDDLIRERRSLRDNAQQEIASKYGEEQTFGGPVISVPYKYITTVKGEEGPIEQANRGFAHFLPSELLIDGDLVPEERHRGIFVAVLYKTKFSISGTFQSFNTEELSIPENSLIWSDARVTIGISDMTGVDDEIKLQMKDTTYSFGPGTGTQEVFTSGANVLVALTGEERGLTFSFDMDLNGSSGLYFRPLGAKTTVNLRSNWPDPSFGGSFLPQGSNVSNGGFDANWEVLQLNRNYPQQGIGAFVPKVSGRTYQYLDRNGYSSSDDGQDRFGVRLLRPVDEYSKTYRSTNYAVLFIILTFLTFFFIEVLNKRRVHPIQYILIGGAVILFYVLLLSLSEHQFFDLAYGISAAAITALITGYSYAVLRNGKLTVLIASVLMILYVFFYSLLQLQDYALLIGSLGLLLILATIMYLTRNIDWYKLGKNE